MMNDYQIINNVHCKASAVAQLKNMRFFRRQSLIHELIYSQIYNVETFIYIKSIFTWSIQ